MYHYKSCGLPSVYLKNGYSIDDGLSGTGVSITDIHGLHQAIALSLVHKITRLTPSEFKFLRIELDLSQPALGLLLEKSDQALAKWEKGINPIPAMADKSIRDLYVESIGETLEAGFLKRIAELDRTFHEHKIELELFEKQHAWLVADHNKVA